MGIFLFIVYVISSSDFPKNLVTSGDEVDQSPSSRLVDWQPYAPRRIVALVLPATDSLVLSRPVLW